MRRLLPDLEDDILESYEEHHVADVLVIELSQMSPEDERFEAKTTVLIENVTHHMDEEEQDWFPKVRDGLGRRPAAGPRRAAPRREEEGAALTAGAERAEEGDRRARVVACCGERTTRQP